MIHLLLFYFLPALISLLLWVTSGWKFSLSAAPQAYRAHLDDQKLSLEARAEKAYAETRFRGRGLIWSDYRCYSERRSYESMNDYNNRIKKYQENEKLEEGAEKAGFIASFMVKNRNLDQDKAALEAKLMGKRCIRRGPFAYFLTPGWATKIECNWYPVEVNVKKIQNGADRTLAALKEINGLEDEEESAPRIGAIV